MTWVDYNQIQEDLVALLIANVPDAELIKSDCDERDYAFSNMPLIDVRLAEENSEVRAGRDYYVFVTYEVQVTTLDLSGHSENAKLRNSVLRTAINAVRDNAKFASGIETSRVGPQVKFSNAKDDELGAFLSTAVFAVTTESFIDA